MQKRMTKVNELEVISLSYSAICEIGDTHCVKPKSRAIAVQKEGAVFQEDFFSFSDYPIFQTQKKPVDLETLSINQKHCHHVSHIQVDYVKVTGASSSSLIQLGNLDKLDAESRIKHIRVLQDTEETTN